MINFKSFTWFSGAAILLLGCQTQVIGGGSGGSGGGGDSGVTSTGTGPVVTATSTGTGPVVTATSTGTGTPTTNDGPAIAMLRSELPPVSVDEGSSAATGGGSPEDPNELFIFLSNVAQSCGDPFASTGGCSTPSYQVAITLPPALQAIGTYSLDQLGFASFSEPEGNNTCSGGGGSYWDGTIDITAIDSTHVTFTLAGTGELLTGGSNADGTYTANRCF